MHQTYYTNHKLKLGLCCLFHKQPIKFKTYTRSALEKLPDVERIDKILSVVSHNIKTLQEAIDFCDEYEIESVQIYFLILIIFLVFYPIGICLGC